MPQRAKWVAVFVISAIGILIAIVIGYIGVQLYSQTRSNSPQPIRQWFNEAASRPPLMTYREACPNAPFILPSDGFIGLLWADPAGPYNLLNRHTGIDIFGDGPPGTVPVYAVYDGELTRLDDWLSTVIIAHDDPLHPGRTLWSYYTHMASEDGFASFVSEEFPAGTYAKPVQQGTLLGYQGAYAGSAAFRVGMHVHLSLVLSEPDGSFKNESQLENTVDPSPYFGLALNIDGLPERPIRCQS